MELKQHLESKGYKVGTVEEFLDREVVIMQKFEEYINEAIANKQITVSLDSSKRELVFNLKGAFPPALIQAMGKALKGNKFTLQDDELKIYV